MRYIFFFSALLTALLYSCGSMTSVGTRYHQSERGTSEISGIKISDSLVLNEDFDITHYKANINITDSIPRFFSKPEKTFNAWYNYDTLSIDTTGIKYHKLMSGYRVLILTTDNLDEANKVKSEIYFRFDKKPVYISFDPPFYKVKAGDFTNSTDANDFSFKLTQLGYSESKTIRDSVKISR